VPYLTIDPQDIGRSDEAIIRINSQSGKGGVAYVLDREHGFDLPKTMHPQVGKRIYDLADEQGRELSADEIRDACHALAAGWRTGRLGVQSRNLVDRI
jgi:2-isopropylmalate synthase